MGTNFKKNSYNFGEGKGLGLSQPPHTDMGELVTTYYLHQNILYGVGRETSRWIYVV